MEWVGCEGGLTVDPTFGTTREPESVRRSTVRGLRTRGVGPMIGRGGRHFVKDGRHVHRLDVYWFRACTGATTVGGLRTWGVGTVRCGGGA